MPINGIYKTKEYEDAFNFICIMAFGHAEYMKELENEAFAIARGKMAARWKIMWKWLQEHHPMVYEAVWSITIALALASVIISVICIVKLS